MRIEAWWVSEDGSEEQGPFPADLSDGEIKNTIIATRGTEDWDFEDILDGTIERRRRAATAACRDEEPEDGYDREGYDEDGYDRDGADRNGCGRDGLCWGWKEDGCRCGEYCGSEEERA